MLSAIAGIGSFAASLFGQKIGFKAAKIVGGIVLLIVLVGFLWAGKALYDRSVVKEHEAEREAKAAPAREDAAEERVKDTIINTKTEREMHDAIDKAPKGGELSPAARSLACERLRRAGRIPPACRSASGDGSQARPN